MDPRSALHRPHLYRITPGSTRIESLSTGGPDRHGEITGYEKQANGVTETCKGKPYAKIFLKNGQLHIRKLNSSRISDCSRVPDSAW